MTKLKIYKLSDVSEINTVQSDIDAYTSNDWTVKSTDLNDMVLVVVFEKKFTPNL